MINIPKFFTSFIAIVVIDLILCYSPGLIGLRVISKPLILISLIAFYLINNRSPSTIKWLILGGLFFSLVGDMVLLFADRTPNAFILGLVSFLLAHIFYTTTFYREINWSKIPTRRLVTIGIPLLLFAGGFLYMLKPHVGEMVLPILAYMSAIISMAFLAFGRKDSVPKISYTLVSIGAILFVISDCLLATNKFYQEIPLADFWIMSSYAGAQLFIVYGMIKSER